MLFTTVAYDRVDLDGDMYDIIWDTRLFPREAFPPADYPRLPAIDIGREVTTDDITRHFVDFMKNDNVGMLSSQLLVLSDRLPDGTRDPLCVTIAELISTALDYPKTGIKVSGRYILLIVSQVDTYLCI
jgi:hypothetical protein